MSLPTIDATWSLGNIYNALLKTQRASDLKLLCGTAICFHCNKEKLQHVRDGTDGGSRCSVDNLSARFVSLDYDERCRTSKAIEAVEALAEELRIEL